MGIFTKKEDKIYSLGKALELLKTEKYKYYTTVPVGNGFKIVSEIDIADQIEETRKIQAFGHREKRRKFLSDLRGEGAYQSFNNAPNYNNYQSAKKYQNYRNLGN